MWTIAIAYIVSVVLLQVPTVQQYVGTQVSKALSQKLGTQVTVGSVDLGFLNRIIIDDVVIKDQQQRDMIVSHRLSARISIIDILQGRISISSAQIFSLSAKIIKPSATEPLNCQFVIDSLKSKDTTHHTPLDLHIGSLVIRNTNVSYDRLDMPARHNTLDVNHLDIHQLSAHLLLNALTDDSLSLTLKKLSLEEHNSGLNIHRLSFTTNADRKDIRLSSFTLVTDNSKLYVSASAKLDSSKVSSYDAIINNSTVSTRDVALFVPKLSNLDKSVNITSTLSGTASSIDISSLRLSTTDQSLRLKAQGKVSSFHDKIWNVSIPTLHIDSHLLTDVLTAFNQSTNQDIINKLSYADATINASGSGNDYKGTLNIKTAMGAINANASYINKHLTAKLSTTSLQLGNILNSNNIGDLQASINLQTDIVGGADIIANTKANISAPSLTLGNNTFRNLNLALNQHGRSAKTELHIADLNINANITATTPNLSAIINTLTHHPSSLNPKPSTLTHNPSPNVVPLRSPKRTSPLTLTADIAHINPHALGIINKWPSRSFSTTLSVDIRDIRHPLDDIIACIDNLHMSEPDNSYHLDHLALASTPNPDGTKTITLDSDFANATIDGVTSLTNIPHLFTDLIASHLPTLPGLPKPSSLNSPLSTFHSPLSTFPPHPTTLTLNLTSTLPLQKIFGIDLTLNQPLTISGYINSATNQSDITLSAPSLTFSNTTYNNTSLHLFSPDDALHILASTAREDKDDTPFRLQIEGQAANNTLNTSISWSNGDEFHGNLHAASSFMTNILGKTQANVNILPSVIMVNDSAWHVMPSTISYYANHLDVDNFSIEHGSQHIYINGTATPNNTDTITANLRDVNVAYILDLANFHSVDFDGLASGTATATSVFSTPEASADLTVRNFLFEHGRMGTLHAKAQWDNQLGQIDVQGLCTDQPGTTKVDGYISIKRNYIDLDIRADRTRLEFLEEYSSSFLDNIQAEGTGNVRVFGDLRTVNLSGQVVANGTVHVISLGTDYTLRNDTVTLIPDEIIFHNDSVFDNRGGYGLVNGALHHKHLTRMTFDFDIDAHHMLCYNFPNLDGNIFCGYCIGSGNCKIKGVPGEITFDIDAYPEATSEITYNVSQPDALQNQEFITWRDPSAADSPLSTLHSPLSTFNSQHSTSPTPTDNFRINMRLNFLIHCTPESTLRLIMDERTGDYITLNGNGTLRATWYNKGGMQIFGNYNVDHGTYKMTMQQVITKNFEFQPGGSIVFGGDPFESTLNLQALYVVPSVSLSDLNLGASLSSGTTRVNCLMNITGTAEHPVVDFDLALPQASSDIQQMITSLMDSEEERTQQVIYLLSIGRFYPANSMAANAEAGTTQTSLAMQSFLSGTLSQQLNNIISTQLLKNNNWNFGANISPGDEGMNNAEYEGLINGRLFNNRLLINGQFGYRDNVNTATSSFIGDFDVRYLITRNGNIQVKIYNQTTDRYFVKNNLNTQGIGIILKHDFDYLLPKFLRKKKQ